MTKTDGRSPGRRPGDRDASGAGGKNPRVVAWEVTRRCPLACRHCRAGAADRAFDDELTTDECFRILDALGSFSRPMIIWTGGEPMYRKDILRLVNRAVELGMRSVMAPCGMLVTRDSLLRLQDAGVMACSFSLDGATAETHDAFRGVQGAFAHVTKAMEIASAIGMPFQVNCTVSKRNLSELPAILETAARFGARTLDLFFLVPVGRGRELADLALSADEMERTLGWAFEMDRKGPVAVRETCAPQAVRIWENLARPGRHPAGCMGGRGFVFISHRGVLQPCGFLDLPCADLRAVDMDFAKAYTESPVFAQLRNPNLLGGTCGKCRFRFECGGCRARSFAATGDFLAGDASCPLSGGNAG